MTTKQTFTLHFLSLQVILVFLAATYAVADEVILRNGDSLTGKIIGIKEGVLTLETSYSEPIKIKYEEVREMSSSGTVELHLTDGEILKGKMVTNTSGQLVIEADSGKKAETVEFAEIAALNPPPKKTVAWKGNVTLGGNMQKGNSDTMNISAGAQAVRRTEDDRFMANILYNRTEDNGQSTAENTFSQLKYDYFLNPKWYLYLNIDMLSNKFQDINLRTSVGPGIGYQVWDEENKVLNLEAGASYTYVDKNIGEDTDGVTARLAANFLKKVFDRVLFTDQIAVYPDLEETGEYLLRNEASLITDIGASLAFKISNIWERNSNPEPSLKQDDFTWILGLQYSFSN